MGKSYEDYTISDLVRLDLGFLVRNKSEATVKQQKEAFQYLLNCATELRVDILDWKLLPDFGLPDTKGIMQVNRAEINRVLMTKLGKVEESTPSYSDSPLQAHKETLVKYTKNVERLLNEKKDAESSRQSSLENAEYYSNEYRKRLNNAKKQSDIITELVNKITAIETSSSDPVFEELCKVHESPNWNFLKVDGKYVYFHTTAPVFQKDINPEAGLNQVLNCGYAVGRVNLDTKELMAFPFAGNYKINEKFHPHVSGGGSICFGDAQMNVASLKSADSWSQVFEIFYQLLNTYSPRNPYITLSDMIEQIESNPEIVRRDSDLKPADFVVEGIDPKEYVLDVPWDVETELKAYDHVVIMEGSSPSRLGIIRVVLGYDRFEVIKTYSEGEDTSTVNYSRIKLAPFDPTNPEHLALCNVESHTVKGFPKIHTRMVINGEENRGVLTVYNLKGTSMRDISEYVRQRNRERNWSIRGMLPRNDYGRYNGYLHNMVMLPCQENLDLGYTLEEIAGYNAKRTGNYELWDITNKITDWKLPEKCSYCDEDIPEGSEIDSDGDCLCGECDRYSRCNRVTVEARDMTDDELKEKYREATPLIREYNEVVARLQADVEAIDEA